MSKYEFEKWAKMFERLGNASAIGRELGIPERTARNIWKTLKKNNKDKVETFEYIHKQGKSLQNAQDNNRILRKINREEYRQDNLLETLNTELCNLLPKIPKLKSTTKPNLNSVNVGILQLSDLHLNEVIAFEFGEFNWDIAAKRLQKHVHQSIIYFKSQGVKNVLVAMTGDMFNSDRRIDELSTNANNRVKALVCGVHLIKQVLMDLVDEGFGVSVKHVIGNESRLTKDIHTIEFMISDNFDTALFYLLKYQCEGIEFIESPNSMKSIVSIGGFNLLLHHGNYSKKKNFDAMHEAIVAEYAMMQGVKIDYAICGHIHNTLIGESFSRSGGLPGANSYSSSLSLYGRPAQNCYVVNTNTKECCGKVNILDNVDDYEGYEILEDLATTNPSGKSKSTVVISRNLI